MEYIDANVVFDVSEDLIEQWIHKLEGDLSILRGELLRREMVFHLTIGNKIKICMIDLDYHK